jgi:hypothetical protein
LSSLSSFSSSSSSSSPPSFLLLSFLRPVTLQKWIP